MGVWIYRCGVGSGLVSGARRVEMKGNSIEEVYHNGYFHSARNTFFRTWSVSAEGSQNMIGIARRLSIGDRISLKIFIDPVLVIWRSGGTIDWVTILILSFFSHYLITGRIRKRVTGNRHGSQTCNFLTGLSHDVKVPEGSIKISEFRCSEGDQHRDISGKVISDISYDPSKKLISFDLDNMSKRFFESIAFSEKVYWKWLGVISRPIMMQLENRFRNQRLCSKCWAIL
jgi:hypothetical protein